jgi:SAM-dependent methyltransferase
MAPRRAGGGRPAGPAAEPSSYPDWVAYEPALVPPPALLRTEGITVLEEWFRWGEEWSVLLRLHGRLGPRSQVMEIGCGLGRIAFPLRRLLGPEGSYTGFEVVREKVEFLERAFTPAYPRFRFVHADVRNSYYNPGGRLAPTAYRFPADDASRDLVFAASVLTHMLPEDAAHYLRETARVLRPGARCVVSVFLLDHYERGQPRPAAFARSIFDFDHGWGAWGDDFATVHPDDPERMTAYRLALLERFAREAGLRLAQPPVPGMWSGQVEQWVGSQDVVVMEHA